MSAVFRTMFPYGMQRNEDGSWTFFNRRYKPVGIVGSDWADWDVPQHKLRLKGVGPATIAKLAVQGAETEDGRVYFYNDATSPQLSKANRQRYFEKLDVLFDLQESSD